MRKTIFNLLSSVLVLLNMACNSTPPPEPVIFNLDRPFTLAIGQVGSFKKMPDFTVKFDKIASDNRCPQGVECITAGQADVVITISKDGKSTTVTVPFIIPNGTGNVTQFEGYTFRVLGVSPMKFKGKELKPEEYSILIKVTEAQSADPTVKPGEEFSIGIGESIRLAGEQEYTIRFDTVSADSRCPEGVECIWAGKVDAEFSVVQGETTQKVVLSTGDMSKGGQGQAAVGKNTLVLKAVSPSKKKDVVIAPNAYKASLVVQ